VKASRPVAVSRHPATAWADASQVFELVKNSLRAVNDRYADRDDLPPPIRLVVAEGGEDVTIKVRPCSSRVKSVAMP